MIERQRETTTINRRTFVQSGSLFMLGPASLDPFRQLYLRPRSAKCGSG